MYKEKANHEYTLNPTKYDIMKFFLENLGFKIYLKCKKLTHFISYKNAAKKRNYNYILKCYHLLCKLPYSIEKSFKKCKHFEKLQIYIAMYKKIANLM